MRVRPFSIFAKVAACTMLFTQPASARVSVPVERFTTGDLVFTCFDADGDGRTFRTLGIYYTSNVQEVTFNHQGPEDALSDGWLPTPISEVYHDQTDDLQNWELTGRGLFQNRNYEFRATIKQNVERGLVLDFTISANGVVMSGVDCVRTPPRPDGYQPFSLRVPQ